MAVVSGTILTLKLLAKSALKKVTTNAIKGKAKDFVVKKAKDKIKSKFKKKKVKGKDVARKMMGGGEEKGGALVKASPSGSIVSSPAGGLIPSSSDTGGELVDTKSSVAKELGLEPFMNSLTSVKESVDSIKKSLNDNNKDAKDRVDDQRLLNNKLNKKEREEELENKKKGSGIGKKLLGPAKDVADNFLSRMTKFFTMTLLGMLVNGLIGGARDVILAFRIGFELLKKSGSTLLNVVGKFKTVLSKSLKSIVKPFNTLGSAIKNLFVGLGNKVLGVVGDLIGKARQWADDAVKWLSKTFPKASKLVTNTTKAAGKLLNQGKTLVKNTASKAKGFVKNTARKVGVGAKRFIGRGARKFLKGGGKKVGSKILKHGLKRGANRLIIKWFGKGAAKTLATVGKTLVKGAKAIKIPVIGPLLVAITSMFSSDPIGKTLFKTAGAAIGGGLGLALGPIGMIVGEIAGEFVGDVLHEGFMGKDGWAGAGKKLKDKFMQILDGGKKVGGWLLNSIKRIGWGGLGTLLNPLAGLDKKFKVVKEGFFPPAEMAESKPNTDGEDVSSSASYEDGADEEPTVVIDGGGGQASSPPLSQEGESGLIVLGSDDSTKTLNTLSNAVLYKV